MHKLVEKYCVWSRNSSIYCFFLVTVYFLFSCSAVLFLFPSSLHPKLLLLNCPYIPSVFFSHFHCLCFPLSLLLLLRLTDRHNSRCLVMVLKTCLLHDGHLASAPSTLQFSSALTPPLFLLHLHLRVLVAFFTGRSNNVAFKRSGLWGNVKTVCMSKSNSCFLLYWLCVSAAGGRGPRWWFIYGNI